MWHERNLEVSLETLLNQQVGKDAASSRLAEYRVARDKVLRNIAAEYKAAEPELSDHGPVHIADVMDRAYQLLAESDPNGSHRITPLLNCEELFLLCEMIVFHDVGNMFGRKDHNRKTAEIFDWARGKEASIRPERNLVIQAAKAHTGEASDGTKDTLKDIHNDHNLNGKSIRLRDLAAVLRLADELAEGPQRTSEYKISKEQYSKQSTIYHEYASITRTHADRARSRIVLTYEFNIEGLKTDTPPGIQEKLESLFDFTYKRVIKLDQERRYTRYYSPKMLPFNDTSVAFNFHNDFGPVAIGLTPLTLDDKVIPGQDAKSLTHEFTDYAIPSLIERLKNAGE